MQIDDLRLILWNHVVDVYAVFSLQQLCSYTGRVNAEGSSATQVYVEPQSIVDELSGYGNISKLMIDNLSLL